MEIPVYLFTGFLEAGKTKFIRDTLAEQPLNEKGKTLLLVCEEGIEEYDPAAFCTPNVCCELIEAERDLTSELLSALQKKHGATVVMVEYNGMWRLQSLYDNLPDGWFIYQELFLCDANTILNYNKNMRSLVVDKLSSCDLAAFNRMGVDADRMLLHKLVRGVSRSAKIIFDMVDGSIEYDTIEDPLPFDINAEIIRIEDRDYAHWYRDLAEDMAKYDGKKVRFKGVVLKDGTVPRGSFICGRHVMTCCADDIQYSGLACKWQGSEQFRSYDWVTVTGKISIERHKVYAAPGPVIKVTSVVPAEPPEAQVATFD